MAFVPFAATVKSSTRISPNFQRVTFTGVDDMGPAGQIMDLRIKLVIPGQHGLPQFAQDGDWYEQWKALEPDKRGYMRTYSIRQLRHAHAHGPAELDIDFALHGIGTAASGPAATWAVEAQPGDELYVIAPQKEDPSGPGIEFQPGDAQEVIIMGDETALPAMLRIADEWPKTLRGTMYCELVDIDDAQHLDLPPNLTVNWVPRSQEHTYGDMLVESASRLCEADNPRGEFSLPEPTPPSDTEPSPLIWETPQHSTVRDEEEDIPPVSSTVAERFANTYFWIAGEATMVTTIRRMLVKGAGIPRHRVSFMGYWKKGATALG
ncbi:siderophore-interacting protein [Corynebacterium ammoniagenes]|uniref:Siderophore-interacting protein n=2 Tax=Corynebacterium ammoniagenes TaxID=1697 RepID=A0AAV5G4Y9_CORAM|nr:siderophore-interacting protein [Corynebacterium ammoniagenes]APT81941.1 iron-chelator utilization protein [Corynebacterium ammoniagenes DSM 20306]AQS73059.1 siderophore-interacting protein [Corynebacterium ammoniagenes]EFG80531.1 Siderophore-interacting FAD-binding domain protein [Corynebacterium ammoniagenes DSM 20306]NMF31716.1 siderophore-interacting protein [Corynebacterium ammoniagenes]GJN41748.1 siderophore-interacting protein [Corynebacterium ammoniagenes]